MNMEEHIILKLLMDSNGQEAVKLWQKTVEIILHALQFKL